MDNVKKFLYSCDHQGFLKLLHETWQNRWFPSQVSLHGDVNHLKSLNVQDREFYKFLFTFLGMAESLVNFNIEDIIKQFESHDMLHYYTEQMAMENIHARMYENILNMFFNNDPAEMYRYTQMIINDRALIRKLDWLHSRIKSVSNKAEKVLLFLLVEGIFFVSSFYSIGLLRVRGMFNGVCLANDYISRDELLHTRAAALLYNTMVSGADKPHMLWVHNLFKEAVEVEHEFILVKSSGVSAVNVDDIRSFLEATADRILKSINLPPIYGTPPPPKCPLVYTGCVKNVNFFERDNSDYTSSIKDDL
ncbi:ribonucleotide reductase small subunit [Bovine gammaherpesvirus 4]|uniref:ribonucleoside-diphosphate reductase n=2 Tax=Bovine herpesvirus 4 TaxID=10385 RepID=A0A0F6N4Z3_BHV4|nr:ribonucleotide reductase small subunit [Bovine gammaherpesvirus 4]AAK07979.1 ribonucleotide reductase small subunit [Bovine gammaherpesvirus 4]AEL29804.1 hypothetical protein [Bovine gammaherpesvirus 4]AIA82805.1 ribonucleotide reductase small subunit [Bovine gammaherpesvirus 4]QJC19109.1 ribonucleotide reductase small subunit [Bovine gammaherpesvirus 4]QJC19184.1 ribonucleotide reductase small subunit [Bovine gammaherpesvirus 4]